MMKDLTIKIVLKLKYLKMSSLNKLTLIITQSQTALDNLY
jgi:hypothetical protein